MKRVLFLLLTVSIVYSKTNAQLGNMLNKAKTTATAAGFDVNKLTEGIMAKLTPSLFLTVQQKPKVTEAVTNFLTQKANILSLQNTKPAEYVKKQDDLFSGLKTTLSGILIGNQMSKFLGLKTGSNNPANPLQSLFY